MHVLKFLLPLLILSLVVSSTQGQTERSQPSKNLLINSSFEDDLAVSGLPKEWTYWSAPDGGDYRAEVVDGGHNGKKSLKLEGTGKSGLVFTNGVKIDRNKRYALRGWVKVEGDKNAKASIKFNYFHERKPYGLADNVVVVESGETWKLQAKTDRAKEVPEASFIWISCVLEGDGKAWFDDLELVSYDADNLPEDFEKQFGTSNRAPELQILERRVGTWETQQIIKPGTWVPDGAKANGVETVEWVLDKNFIQFKNKQEPGETEALAFLAFDSRSNVFRTWFFDSNGNLPRNEITGKWDESTQTLTFKATDPEDITLETKQKFVGTDRIESKSVWTAKDGSILMEIDGTATRKK